MKNLVDSSGWLEYFTGGPNAEAFAAPLHSTAALIVPVICIYEVFKVMLRERSESDALLAAAAMQRGTVVEVSAQLALAASKLGLQHKLPMADSLILATARVCEATIWTQDADFRDLPSVKYVEKRK